MAAHWRNVSRVIFRNPAAFLTRDGRDFAADQRRFVRGLVRKPVRVLFPDEGGTKSGVTGGKKKVKAAAAAEGGGSPSGVKAKQWRPETRAEPSARRAGGSGGVTASAKLPQGRPAPLPSAVEQLHGFHFEKAAPGDTRLAKLTSVARSRTFREHQGKVLLEGRRLICDALDAGANPQVVFFSRVENVKELPLDKLRRATLVKVDFKDIKTWSDVVAPQGVLAIFSRPDPSTLNFCAAAGSSVPLSLICDNVRDPGNLGTILRCAAAAGCQRVLLTKGCVDAWEPKVLRAAMGAHFRLPIYTSLDWPTIRHHLPEDVTVHVADSSCGTDPEPEVNASAKPLKAGDLGWVSTRRSCRTTGVYDSDSDLDSDGEGEGLPLPRLSARLYHENWARDPTALVVGGETHGFSLEALELTEKTMGRRLFIPVVPRVESLNSAMAASILLFEGRKQLLELLPHTSRRRLGSEAEEESQ